MEHDEWIHPAAMGRRHEEVATRRQMLLPIGPDPEPEADEQDETSNQPDQAIQARSLRLRRSPEPDQAFDGAAPRRRERFG
jgi:hypothetical protein